ncbi:MAG: glycoside hydrolase family 2 TIM barrel-domain containing protein [candidate division KSB1 bacterium]|nr:glycoside hydrolase family 2 TIM barrel-domain containing protein [candidate division KSB1 bacterium]MDQ7065697.1 glycoside hydrolase family 2 TIM barrel-domain containing protein [candidate division KSB1 bacterium]
MESRLLHIWPKVRRGIALFGGILLLAALAASAPARPQNADTLQWRAISPTRSVASLSGTWQMQSKQVQGTQPVTVPGFLTGMDNAHFFRDFYLPADLSSKAFKLRAEGIHYDCKIWINDHFVGGHRGGYSRFEMFLNPSWLQFGASNRIRIEADRRLNAFYSLPPKHRPFGTPNPLGIHRDLSLEAMPPLIIDDVQAAYSFSPDYQQAEMVLQVGVRQFKDDAASSGEPQEWSIFAELRTTGPQSRVVAISQRVPFRMPHVTLKIEDIRLAIKAPRLWSPENPELYQLTVFLSATNAIVDMTQFRVGLREVAVRNHEFYLNGRPFIVKAVDWIENLSGLSGDSLAARIDRTLSAAKALGANAIRVLGRQAHPALVERCSERGIFVLEELPVYYTNARQLAREQVLKMALNQLEEMIQRDKFQPSVLAWGLGGYLQENDPRTEQFVDRMIVRARQLDARPLYLVTRHVGNTPVNLATDFLLFDVFEKSAEQVRAFDRDARPVLPVIGYMINLDLAKHTQMDEARTLIEMEEVQAERLQQALEFLTTSWPNYAGHVVHALYDWQSERPSLLISRFKPPYVCPAGLIAMDSRRRIGYQMVAAYHLQDRPPPISPTPNLAIRSPVFTVVGVAIILIFLFFLRRDKRLRGHLRRIFVHPHGFYMDIRENRKVPAFLTLLLGILEGAIWGCIVAGLIWSLRNQLIFNEIVDLLTPSVAAKEMIVWLAWHPGVLIAVVAATFLLLMTLLAIALRVISMFRRESLPMIQYMTLMFWTGSNYIVLSPIAPIYYRLVEQPGFFNIGLAIVGLFFIWHMLRLYRGVRVLYLMPAPRAALILLVLLVLIFGSLIWYFQQSQAVLDYFAYYRDVLN